MRPPAATPRQTWGMILASALIVGLAWPAFRASKAPAHHLHAWPEPDGQTVQVRSVATPFRARFARAFLGRFSSKLAACPVPPEHPGESCLAEARR